MGEIKDFVIDDGLLRRYTGKEKVVVIPDGVTTIGYAAFVNCTEIISITIPDSVTRIDKYAFFCCEHLAVINIPHSVTSIGDSAFLACKNLKKFVVPAGEISIGREAFRLCRGLADEKGFVIIRNILFDYYGNDSTVTIPECITGIDDYAFYNCSNIKKLIIPDSVKTIGKDAFRLCTDLKTIELPENIQVYENSVIELLWDYFYKTEHRISIMYSMLKQYPAFVVDNVNISKKIKANKKKLFALALEEDAAEILEVLFSLYKKINLDELNEFIELAESSTSLKAFLMNYKGEKYTAEKQEKYENDNVDKELGIKERSLSDWKKIYNFSIEGEKVTITGYKGKATDVLVPEKIGKYKVDAIDVGAFSPSLPGLRKETKKLREKIRTVVIPNSVRTVRKGAFCECKKLTSVILPEGMKDIGWGTFGNCVALTSLKIPDSVTSIADFAFANCLKLTSITIPEKVISIGERVFLDCKALSSINFSGKVLRMGEQVFKGCEALADENGFVIVNRVLYGYYGSENNITIPAKTEKIESDAFSYCNELETVIIPESVKNIGESAFSGCHSLESIRIPKSIMFINRGVFSHCTNLEKIVFENSLTEISQDAFVGCPNLTIYARAGSCAEKYANKYGISFVRK